MEAEAAIERLENFIRLLDEWDKKPSRVSRDAISRERAAVEAILNKAACSVRLDIAPPPAIGGLVMRNVNPFTVMFNPPHNMNILGTIRDAIHHAIGVISSGGFPKIRESSGSRGTTDNSYAFIAMAIDAEDKSLVDVLDTIKDATSKLGIRAERVDEQQSNTRITDRILSSIQQAGFIICDLTGNKPNVFYEAGYALGLGRLPIYIARKGTNLQFDVKDYPVIFFESMRELRDGLTARLQSLINDRA
jgi:hypothetical protein